jgi:hypothetical protein
VVAGVARKKKAINGKLGSPVTGNDDSRQIAKKNCSIKQK